MNRIRTVLTLILLSLFSSSAMAQKATIFQLTDGRYIGIAYTPSGVILLTEVEVIKIPDPQPPPPITTGPVGTVIIRTVDTLSADQSQALSDLRQWTDQQPADKVDNMEFPPDAVGPDGAPDKAVAAWVSKIPSSSKQPYVFVIQRRADGKAVTLWQGELGTTADPIIAKIKEFVK